MIHSSVTALVLCALSAMFMSFVPRHKAVMVTLREARRCGQSSVARRLHPLRFNAVAVGAGGGTLGSLVLQR